jgi:hypothetical protein
MVYEALVRSRKGSGLYDAGGEEPESAATDRWEEVSGVSYDRQRQTNMQRLQPCGY